MSKLRQCWDNLLARYGETGWDDWRHFGETMAAGCAPGKKIARRNIHVPHGPGNSYWADKHEQVPTSDAPRYPRWSGHRNGALVLLRGDGRVRVSENSNLYTTQWVALCDCGRLCHIKGARFKRTPSCRHRACPYRRTRSLYRGKDYLGQREQDAYYYSLENEILNTTEPLFPLSISFA